MKNLPYTQLIIDKLLKIIDKPTELLLDNMKGTEFQSGYDIGRKEIIEQVKKIKID